MNDSTRTHYQTIRSIDECAKYFTFFEEIHRVVLIRDSHAGAYLIYLLSRFELITCRCAMVRIWSGFVW